jgi:serine kinase of HPr protein (carbohydrate metabolism regulator)
MWHIQRAGVEISVRLKSKDAEEFLQPILEGLQATKVRSMRGKRIVVGGKPGSWVLIDRDNDIERKLKLDGDLIYHFTDRIVFHVANNAKDVHCIHAAAVGFKGGVIIVPAHSGAGKSTFTTWLVANGFDYITDELILIDKDLKIDGIGRPIQIKANGIDAIKPLLTSSHYARGNMANAVPVDCLGGQVVKPGSNRLAAFVFPRFERDSGFNFTQLSSAEAGLNLMNNHVNARNLEDHGFRAMMALIRATPRYSLKYGGFADLPNDFAEQLKQLCTAT